MRTILTVILLLVGMAFGTCHNLDTTTAFQDVLNRWLADENGTTLREFSILAESWLDPKFLSTNPCITFTVKGDRTLTAVFEEEATIKESLTVEPATVEDTRSERERMYPLMETVWINHTGKRYHLETCFWRGLVPIETNVLEAMLAGKTACGHCEPFVEDME